MVIIRNSYFSFLFWFCLLEFLIPGLYGHGVSTPSSFAMSSVTNATVNTTPENVTSANATTSWTTLFSTNNSSATNITHATTVIHNVTTTFSTATVPQSTVTTENSNSSSKYPQYVGFIGAGIAIFFFGTNFIPVKKFETGDGVFFQLIMCIAIWLVAVIVHAVRGFPKFYALPMLGGAMWCTGNMCCVPIIKCIGLGIGLLVWSSFNLLSGWASGRFGWFGINPQIPKNITMNYIGVALALFSGVIFMFIKTEVSTSQETQQTQQPHHQPDEWSPLLNPDNNPNTIQNPRGSNDQTSDWTTRLSPTQKRIVGVLLSAFAGPLFGLSFTPAIYIWDNDSTASKHGLDYVFAQASGSMAASAFYFLVYCMIKKNNPDVYPQAVLPGALSGAMWQIAFSAWFVANEALSEAVSFPIVTTGPGIVASFCGIVFFREIRGAKNYILFTIAFVIIVTGSVLCGLSKG